MAGGAEESIAFQMGFANLLSLLGLDLQKSEIVSLAWTASPASRTQKKPIEIRNGSDTPMQTLIASSIPLPKLASQTVGGS